jgi:hypothetical protein
MRRRVLLALNLITLLTGCSSAGPSTPAAPPTSAETVCKARQYPLILGGGRPFAKIGVTVAAGPREALMLLDTGNDGSNLDLPLAKDLPNAPPPNEKRIVVRSLDYGVDQPNVTLNPLDYGAFALIEGHRQDGVLGTDYLCEYVLDLNFAKRVATVVGTEDVGTCSADWLTMACVGLVHYAVAPPASGVPHIPTATLTFANGATSPCQFDTGKEAVEGDVRVLSMNPAAFRGIAGDFKAAGTRALNGTEGNFDVQLYIPKSGGTFQATLGQLTVTLDQIEVHPEKAGPPYALSAPIAVVGMSILKQWPRMIVDPFEQRLCVGDR